MLLKVESESLLLRDPYGGREALLVSFQEIRFLDCPDGSNAMRVALGASNGLMVQCVDAPKLLERVDAAVTALLRYQIHNDRSAVERKVRTAAGIIFGPGNRSHSVSSVVAMMEQGGMEAMLWCAVRLTLE